MRIFANLLDVVSGSRQPLRKRRSPVDQAGQTIEADRRAEQLVKSKMRWSCRSGPIRYF